MSISAVSAPYPVFRHRPIGRARAASPPTWACYEQIPYDNSDSESCSDSYDDSDDSEEAMSCDEEGRGNATNATPDAQDDGDAQNMDMDDGDSSPSKDIKGKGRAVEPDPERVSREAEKERKREERRQKKKELRRQNAKALRPILTIQKSEGFVWNQDLFVPPYIKDRYVTSTSPPGSRGFISSSVSSTASSITDYETVEVVEIRIKPGEFSF